MQPATTTLQRTMKDFSASLKGVFIKELKEKRMTGERHDRELAKKRAEQVVIRRKALHITKRALVGANKLIQIWNSKEVSEMLQLYQKIGARPIKIFEYHLDYVVEYLNWQWTASNISMSAKSLQIFVQHAPTFENEFEDVVFELNDPHLLDSYGNSYTITLQNLISGLLSTHNSQPEWIVDANNAVESFTPLKGDMARVGWLAFLAACDNDEFLARVFQDALSKASHETPDIRVWA